MTSDGPGLWLPGTESQWNEEEVEMERKGGKFRRKRSKRTESDVPGNTERRRRRTREG